MKVLDQSEIKDFINGISSGRLEVVYAREEGNKVYATVRPHEKTQQEIEAARDREFRERDK